LAIKKERIRDLERRNPENFHPARDPIITSDVNVDLSASSYKSMSNDFDFD
jgi:hypothetical protein